MKHVVVAMVVLASMGCRTPVCEPGSMRSCSCSGGRSGDQSCDEQGAGWTSCRCEDPPSSPETPQTLESVVGGVALSGTSAPVNDGPSKGMPGKVDPGEPEIGTSTTGGAVITSIDKTPIKKVIDAHLADIESCHEGDDAGHPSQEGKVVVLFTISTKGDVSEAEIESSTVDDQDIEACIVEHVKKWTFPPPASGRPIPVRYPFSLDPSS